VVGLIRSSRSGVVDSVMGQLVVERHSDAGDGDRVAVIAHWSAEAQVSRSLGALARSFADRQYRVVLCSAASVPDSLRLPEDLVDRVTVLRKPNVGYDFGSWAVAQAWDPSIRQGRHVILVNDSLVGPFGDLGDVISRYEASHADVLGLTNTTQFGPHLQSYFLGFNRGALADPPLAAFWLGIRHQSDKAKVIQRYEIGLGRLLRREGFSQDAIFPYWKVVQDGLNPTISGWRGLLELGFPFLKREILRRPEVAPGGDQAPDVVGRMFGVNVKDWL
jgi:lipopolysaccharide biosynthesis protein